MKKRTYIFKTVDDIEQQCELVVTSVHFQL